MADDQCLREGAREAHSNEQAADHQCLREGPNEPRSPPPLGTHGVRAGRGRSPETALGLGLASLSGPGSAGGVSFGLPPQSVTDLEGTLGAGLEPGLGTGCGHVRPPVVPPPPAPPSSAQGQLPQNLENITFSNCCGFFFGRMTNAQTLS